MDWLPIILLGLGAALTGVSLLRVPRESWMVLGVFLMLGLAGYSVAGSPSLPAAPKASQGNTVRSGEEIVAARRSLFDDGLPPPPYLVVSDGFARQGRFADAASLLRQAVNDHPRDAEAWLALAIALVEHADGQVTPPAIAAFSNAQEAFPNHPGAGYFLGQAYLRSGRPLDAKRVWTELLNRTPQDAPWRQDLEFRLAGLDQLIERLNEMQREMTQQNSAQ